MKRWLLHLAAVVAIVAAGMPMAKWYFDYSPLWGVDFFYTASLVKQFANSPVVWPALGWSYAWFGGWPMVSSFPILHVLLAWPVTAIWGLISGVKIWVIVTFAGYFLGLYACCWTISRNRVLAVMLAMVGIYSVGVYGALMWGGSLPSHATQMFYPWAIWPVIKFVKEGKRRWMLLGGVIAGLAILGHPQIVIAYVFPTVFVLLVCWFGVVKFLSRIMMGVVYAMVAMLVGLPILFGSAGDALKVLVLTGAHQVEVASSTVKIPATFSQDVENFHKAQPKRIITDTNFGVFELGAVGIGLWLLAIVFRFKQKSWGAVIATMAVAGLYVGYITIYAYGISIYHGGWYRLFWTTPLTLGMAVAALWGSMTEVLTYKLGKKAAWGGALILGLLALGVGISGLTRNNRDLKSKIEARSAASSAFPDIVNMQKTEKQFKALKSKMVPRWLDPDETNYRMYSADQTINIWWNALYKMPLARGYYDPPINAKHRGYFFWVDAALSQDSQKHVDQLVGAFNYDPVSARNNTLYLVDWYGIKYLEAGHAGLTTFSPLPTWMQAEDVMKRTEELDFNREKFHTGNQTLKYWEMKDDLVSPILAGVNVPVVGVVGSEIGYENVTRAMADANLNSQKMMVLNLGKKLDNLGNKEMDALDLVILYDYDYFNKAKAFGWVERFLTKGKSVFVDTGIENKESKSDDLPGFFPIVNTDRKGLGLEWEWSELGQNIFADVRTEGFTPPVFDGQPWSFSYPIGVQKMKTGSQVLARNKGQIVMAESEFGSGRVIWSGMNLPYLVSRNHGQEEVKLWANLIGVLTAKITRDKVQDEVVFVNAQSRKIETTGARGILFKEQDYPGWMAFEGWSRLPIFKAGPTYPGFMYIPVSDKTSHVVKIKYLGSPVNWILTLISASVAMAAMDIFVLGGRIGSGVYKKIGRWMGGWLSKDRDYE